MENKYLKNVGCKQTATKNTIKTAQIPAKNNILVAACYFLQYRCGSCSSVWPKNNKNNNKISTQRHLGLLLITMAVLMPFLQLPNGANAATVMRGKDERHHHDSSSSSNSMTSNDTLEIRLNDHIEKHSSLAKRTRLHKRHTDNLYLKDHLEESTTDLEWYNPCNGQFEPSSEDVDSFRPPASHFLKEYRKFLSTQFHTINHTMLEIDISDLKMWEQYRDHYDYLPRVKKDSKINLKTWYSGIQVYIGALTRLGRMQYKYDIAKHMYTTRLTHELNDLVLIARRVLCEVETTINGSYPFPANQKKLKSFTREAMNARLKFVTHERMAHMSKHVVFEPEMVDLQFVKSKFYHYLLRMWRVINKRTRRGGKNGSQSRSEEINLSLSSSASSSSSSSSRSRLSDSGSWEFSGEYGSRAGKPTRRQ